MSEPRYGLDNKARCEICGATMPTNLIVDHLRKHGVHVTLTTWPDGTPVADHE